MEDGDGSLYNVYGPNDNNKVFFHSLGSRVQVDSTRHIVVGRDLNSVHTLEED